MFRLFASLCLAGLLCVGSAVGQEGPDRGTIKAVDPEKQTITVTVQGKERVLRVTDATRVMAGDGQRVENPFEGKALAVGKAVMFLTKEGSDELRGLRVAPAARPQGRDIRRATIKALDPEKKSITLTVGNAVEEYALTDSLQVLGASGKDLAERLKGFKVGADVQFLVEPRDGKPALVGLRLADGGSRPDVPRFDSSKLKPLTVLGKETYQGHEGGLYPGGSSERPAAHESAGLAMARHVRPLDRDGKPADDGKVVLLSVGMSNTTQEFSTFKRLADEDADRNPSLVVVDGAQGGMTAARIKDPDDNASGSQFWRIVDSRLGNARVSREQVQVAWIKQADAGPSQGFPEYAKTLQAELKQLVRAMHRRFPNLKLVYLSSRTFGGYARTPLNPEPYAFESGLSVKWLIAEQLQGDKALNFDPANGPVEAPWLAWGPYLWANGTTRNPDGLFYEESDFGNDGTHPSPSGRRKVAEKLLSFFKTDSTAKLWFLRGGK